MRSEYDFSQGNRGKHAGKKLRIIGDPKLEGSVDRVGTTKSKRTGNSLDVTDRILRTRHVAVSWVYENTEGYVYQEVPGSIVANPSSKSLRFELTERNSDDDNFEVVIRKQNGAYILRADHPEIETREFPLKVYQGSEELVFYLEDSSNRAYFHLS